MSHRKQNSPDSNFAIVLKCPICGKTGGRGNDSSHANGGLKNHKKRAHGITGHTIQLKNKKPQGDFDVNGFLDALGLLIEESKYVKY